MSWSWSILPEEALVCSGGSGNLVQLVKLLVASDSLEELVYVKIFKTQVVNLAPVERHMVESLAVLRRVALSKRLPLLRPSCIPQEFGRDCRELHAENIHHPTVPSADEWRNECHCRSNCCRLQSGNCNVSWSVQLRSYLKCRGLEQRRPLPRRITSWLFPGSGHESAWPARRLQIRVVMQTDCSVGEIDSTVL